MTAARRIQIFIGLLLVLTLPFCHLSDLGHRLLGENSPIGSEFLWWIFVAAVLLYVVAIERKPLSSIGYPKPGIFDTVSSGIAARVAIIRSLYSGGCFSSADGTPQAWRCRRCCSSKYPHELLARHGCVDVAGGWQHRFAAAVAGL